MSINIPMIISYQHEFIFIKTKKTAGSSIEHYLFPYLGPKDVCSGSALDGTPSLNPIKMKKGHVGWKWLSEYYSREWRKFYSFAVVRNPWDTVVSAYFWFRSYAELQGTSPEEFGDFADWISRFELHTLDPWPLFAGNAGPVVDKVLRYENLHQELATIPVPYAGEILSVFKKSGMRESRDYKQFYTDQSRQRVHEVFSKVIDHFGYEF